MVSFRSWTQGDTVRRVPLDRLLIETDSPYLAPVPYRGRRNEPAFVAEVVRALGTMRDETDTVLREATTANAVRLFWPPDPPESRSI